MSCPLPPDFCIVGGPKCGTSALYEQLKQHPDIFMTDPKEPQFFGEDKYPFHRKQKSFEDYQALYDGAKNGQLRGEASVMYLYWPQGLDRLLEHNPAVKCIAVIRNPVDHFKSWHNHYYKRQFETIADHEQAWDAQGRRAKGEDIPPLCPTPEFLQYKNFSALGSQLGTFMEKLSENQRLILLFDEFKNNQLETYQTVLQFLALPDFEGVKFETVNQSAIPRINAIQAFIQKQPPILRLMRAVFKAPLNALGIHPNRIVNRLNEKPAQHKMNPAFRKKLVQYFEPEIQKIEALLNKDLNHWRT